MRESSKVGRNGRMPARLAMGAALFAALSMGGCGVSSYFDPSKTGYFQHDPITVPILERLDAVEMDDDSWGRVTSVSPEDLVPGELEYRIAAGDVITVEIFELVAPGQVTPMGGRVDQSGTLRLTMPLRAVPAAGLTLQELEDVIVDILDPDFLRDPLVTVRLEEGRSLQYSVEGNIRGPSVYLLSRPDLRLSEALAIAGGVPVTSRNIYVIRPIPLDDAMRPSYDRPGTRPGTTPPSDPDQPTIDDLLDQLQRDRGGQPDTRPGMLGERLQDPPIDIDDLQPRRVSDRVVQDPSDVPSSVRNVNAGVSGQDTFVFIEERGEWVRVRMGQDAAQDDIVDDFAAAPSEQMVLQRVIKIPADRLQRDSSYNIIVRPGDRIFVEPPVSGVVYIGGEVLRPGVFQLPPDGELTLSRLVTAAGGFGALAIPERVDLVRRVGENRQAAMRVNLRAIRNMSEPDILLKPDDHILVGTSWIATPLAIIRNGFRATYGFGFLLDRNFGNDVFGAPPTNRLGF